jgi:hypothetical protein
MYHGLLLKATTDALTRYNCGLRVAKAIAEEYLHAERSMLDAQHRGCVICKAIAFLAEVCYLLRLPAITAGCHDCPTQVAVDKKSSGYGIKKKSHYFY